MKIFLTGVTGFLAGELLVLLSQDERVEKIYCLLRASTDRDADKRLAKVLAFHGDYFDRKKVIPVIGDLSEESLPGQLKSIEDVDTVIHAAADTSFAPSHNKNIHLVNVVGATNVAQWAASLPALKTFVYVGTSWIRGCDDPGRVVYEDESPNPGYNHLVEYSRSKAIGEIMMRKTIPEGKLLVVRPSIIIGDSRPWTPRSYVISWSMEAWDLLRLVSVNQHAALDMIPVDYAAEVILALLFSRRNFDTYHISAGTKSSTNLEQLLDALGSDNRLPFLFVDYKMMKEMQLFSEGCLPDMAELREYSQYLRYWDTTFTRNGILRKLLWAINFYCQFANLGLVFDNTRLLADTTVGPSEPAHAYMGRNKMQLRKINVLGDIDP